jgi:hypothetical protein
MPEFIEPENWLKYASAHPHINERVPAAGNWKNFIQRHTENPFIRLVANEIGYVKYLTAGVESPPTSLARTTKLDPYFPEGLYVTNCPKSVNTVVPMFGT